MAHIQKKSASGEQAQKKVKQAGPDAVLPFWVQDLDIKGRIVQLNTAVTSILERHGYPDCVNYLLAQMMGLTVLLGTSLKFSGKFILQTHSDGPVTLLVCDFTTPQALRAYARFDEVLLQDYIQNGRTQPQDLLGKGTLALTIDQGPHMQRYQGIVALDGTDLETIAKNYFLQSEQIPTDLRLSAAKVYKKDQHPQSPNTTPKAQWYAGAILVQFLPESEQKALSMQEDAPQEDHWQEVRALINTIEDGELTDPLVPVETLLYRLFHEHEIRVFDPIPIFDQCACSREKTKELLESFSPEERAKSIEDGKIEASCAFCSSRYIFTEEELEPKKS